MSTPPPTPYTPAQVTRQAARAKFIRALQSALEARPDISLRTVTLAAYGAHISQGTLSSAFALKRSLSDHDWEKLTGEQNQGPWRHLSPEKLAELNALRLACYTAAADKREGAGDVRTRWQGWIADVDAKGEDADLAWQLLKADVIAVVERLSGVI